MARDGQHASAVCTEEETFTTRRVHRGRDNYNRMSEPPDLAPDTCRYIATVAIIKGIKTPLDLVAIPPGSVHCDRG
jgi:hypothetical protein